MEILILVAVLVLLAEVTYLLTQQRQQGGSRGRAVFVDTSVLIDGRIVAIAQSGFLSDTLSIPRSVIGELQFLADNADSEKRARARHGLDVVAELQAIEHITVRIFQDGSRASEGVDERLLHLAKKYNGAVCTIDYNLNKVAQVENIPVLNVNELARTLRMAYLPGEHVHLALTSKGNDNSQAVGHLDDGTMVVVEQAKAKIGTVVEVEIIRSLQTAAGKMMFARLVDTRRDRAASQQSSGEGQSSRSPKGRTPRKSSTKPVTETVLVETPAAASVPILAASPASQKPSSQANQSSRRRSPAAVPNNAPTPQSATSSAALSRPRQTRRRRPESNEDRLIELVNNQ